MKLIRIFCVHRRAKNWEHKIKIESCGRQIKEKRIKQWVGRKLRKSLQLFAIEKSDEWEMGIIGEKVSVIVNWISTVVDKARRLIIKVQFLKNDSVEN